MITRIFVSNFKALNNFEMSITPITVIIGENSSGKSSVLQALDFICKFVQKETSSYLDSRDWQVDDILCNYKKGYIHKAVNFRVDLELLICNELKKIRWEVKLEVNSTSSGFCVIDEAILLDIGVDNGTYTYPLLRANRSNGITITPYLQVLNQKRNEERIPFFISETSFLKMIDEKNNSDQILVSMKKYFEQSESFELLSPSSMRQGSRGTADSIGYWGEKLGAYLKGLSQDEKAQLINQIKNLVPFITDIQAKVKGRPYWIDLSIKEQFGELTSTIHSKHISDGLLRIIALLSISFSRKKSGLVLLDEIENGINPYLASRIVSSLKKVVNETHRQIIVTTHSSVMLDYFDPSSIIYLSRGKDGESKSTALFSSESIKERLSYFYPGEAWLNLSQDEIHEAVYEDNEEKK